MSLNHEIGRNAPCPCGSGKKYKKCHGAVPANDAFASGNLDINREIAYTGKIGQMRRDFSVAFIRNKQDVIRNIEKTQAEMALSRGETITCHKGCSYCCTQYVDASIQEAEAIVFYLYQNEGALNNFLQAYPGWRERVHACGDSFQQIVRQWEKTEGTGWHCRKTVEGGLASLYEFTVANIPCPFLHDSACSIHEVRPYVCAGAFATTPAELCQPLYRSRAKIYTTVPPALLDDTSFYYRRLERPVQDILPIMVYSILSNGIIGMPEIPGIEGLSREFMGDPDVSPILRNRLKSDKTRVPPQ
jgi:hypothetical protein